MLTLSADGNNYDLMPELNTLIVGCGRIAGMSELDVHETHAFAIEKHKDLRRAGCVDIDESRSHKFSERCFIDFAVGKWRYERGAGTGKLRRSVLIIHRSISSLEHQSLG